MFFDDTTAQFTDLSGVRILRCGVDTVRQLYNGKLRPEVMALFDLSVDVVEFAGYEWSKGRIGRDSGYQYRLQNAEMGLILLIKNHNIKVDTIGSHLKIEYRLTPSMAPIRASSRACWMIWPLPC